MTIDATAASTCDDLLESKTRKFTTLRSMVLDLVSNGVLGDN